MELCEVVSPTVLDVDAELGEDVLSPRVLLVVDCPAVELLELSELDVD